MRSSSSLFCVHFFSDIDECSSKNECDVNARCTNIIGSYNCTCKKGFGGDGRNCSGKVQSNERTIATNADSFVLQVRLSYPLVTCFFAHVDVVVVATLFCLDCMP